MVRCGGRRRRVSDWRRWWCRDRSWAEPPLEKRWIRRVGWSSSSSLLLDGVDGEEEERAVVEEEPKVSEPGWSISEPKISRRTGTVTCMSGQELLGWKTCCTSDLMSKMGVLGKKAW